MKNMTRGMRLMVGFNRLVLGALLLIAPAITWAETAALDPTVPERVTWQKTPIALALNVGKERRVDFPGPVKVGVPATLQAMLRVQSVAGTLYLLARQAFEPTRLMVRTLEGGDVYLLDLSASEKDGFESADSGSESRDGEIRAAGR